MDKIFLYLMAFVGGGLGIVTTIYFLAYLFGALGQKIYRKIRCGTSWYD